MGFRTPEEVPSTFLVTGPSRNFSLNLGPGRRHSMDSGECAVSEIIAAEGRRTPDSTVSQRRFRFAFIMIVRRELLPRSRISINSKPIGSSLKPSTQGGLGPRLRQFGSTDELAALHLSAAGVFAGRRFAASFRSRSRRPRRSRLLLRTQTEPPSSDSGGHDSSRRDQRDL